MFTSVGAVDMGWLIIRQQIHADAFVCCFKKSLPQLKVVKDEFGNYYLSFEAIGGLELKKTAEEMSGSWEDVANVVETAYDGFEFGGGGFYLVDQFGDQVNPGDVFGVGDADDETAGVVEKLED